MISKKIEIIRDNEWYNYFIEECRAIVVETRLASTLELLKGKWELGKRIIEEELNFKRAGYGEKVIHIVADDLGMSESHVYKCVQFYKKFSFPIFEDVVSELPEGKVVSWYKVCQKYLPKSAKEKESNEEKEKALLEKQERCSHNRVKCLDCGKLIKKSIDIL